ncbi:hypothetical protein [Leptolyngbya sp. FACHB-261]|uniref:hypothetical protein n=1 Tax=Leptolyngbya sp. FACHB-261 TaxID=2692806 RepID=UPI0016897299|nr:hypothetical protein [Leptolyngbya sp. FACHB-261]
MSQAMQAAQETQSATSKGEWHAVARQWQEAVRLMRAVPQASAHHAIAQKKVGEYERNLAYAQQQSQEWRFITRYGKKSGSPGWQEYLDITSVTQLGEEGYEFRLLNSYEDGVRGYKKLRVNCRSGYIDYLSLIQESSAGTKTDLSQASDLFDGAIPSTAARYCQLLAQTTGKKMIGVQK